MPINSPLMTVPTTRPRFRSEASEAAKGTRICAATEDTPTIPTVRSRTSRSGAKDDANKAAAASARMRRYQSAPDQDVAERHHQRQSEAVADLGGRHHEGGAPRPAVQVARDLREQRLGVVEVGRRQAARDHGEEGDPAGRHGVGLR